jgi:exoribonuclease R
VPGGAVDAEVEQRGVTLYAPDRRVPLHPPVLGERAASLLPDGPRPALLWQLDLDDDGELTATDVRRARVRSRAQLDYEGVQRELDSARSGWRSPPASPSRSGPGRRCRGCPS